MRYLSAGFPPYFKENIFQSHWQLTQRCNFHCAYCVNRHLRSQGIHMPENIMRTALEMMAPLDASRFHFCLTGGEPGLYPHLDAMLSEIARLFSGKASVNIMSNGSFGGERLKALAREFSPLKLRFVISIHPGQTSLAELIAKLAAFTPRERERHFTLKLISPPGESAAGVCAKTLGEAGIDYNWLPALDFQKGSLAPGYSPEEMALFLHKERKPWFHFRHVTETACEDVTFMEGIARNMFHYRGMNCAAGRQSIFLDEHGNVSRGQFCGRMPYTILEQNPFEDPDFYNGTICQEEHCACVPFTALPKWSQSSQAPASSARGIN